MNTFKPFSLSLHGKLHTYNRPLIMGIVNATPDSFYSKSRKGNPEAIKSTVGEMLSSGVDIIDLGAYSSRPGAEEVTVDEEIRRISYAMGAIRELSQEVVVSIDTFRADVARVAVEDYGADIINDISGGDLDENMWETVGRLKVPYIIMHMRGNPSTMQSFTDYEDVTAEVIKALSEKLRGLRLEGIADVIVDPGFGFSKTLEQNFELMRNLDVIVNALEAPLLVGISRKSMITKALGIETEEALDGTTALNTIALSRGASILRVHDVAAAKAALRMWQLSN